MLTTEIILNYDKAILTFDEANHFREGIEKDIKVIPWETKPIIIIDDEKFITVGTFIDLDRRTIFHQVVHQPKQRLVQPVKVGVMKN